METLWGLWALWQDGPVDPNTVLWGRPLWGWSRIGTVAQVMALLGLALELIGFARIQAVSNIILHTRIMRRLHRSYFEDDDSMRQWLPAALDSPLALFILLTLGVVFFIVPIALWHPTADVYRDLTAVLTANGSFFSRASEIISVGLWAILLTYLFVGTLIGATVFFCFVLLKTVLVTLRSPKLRFGLNIAIFAATIFNLHFALLTQ